MPIVAEVASVVTIHDNAASFLLKTARHKEMVTIVYQMTNLRSLKRKNIKKGLE